MDVKDKTIIIHGGTSGIGKELVCTLVSRKANVIFSGTNKQKGQDVIEGLNSLYKGKRPHNAIFYNMNVTDWRAQEEIYTFAEKSFGKTIDIVIVVAGILDSSNLINDTENDGHYQTIDVNLTATIKANRFAVQYFLKKKKAGCVINTSSVYGLAAGPTAPMYAASKHAIIGLTKSYGNLLRSTNIRVNAIAPHFVETPMIPGESFNVIKAFGTVSMKSCIDAYLYAIADDSLNGDIISVSHLGTTVQSRFSDPLLEQLDFLSSKRRENVLNAILDQFQ
ncbi:uncharacterized protein B0P05DRAFT_589307 [Gilbertella persicaria]|uniref:uncharacterized protein n=1 Tax=Gilbertella persicaria TaxID=101096 RepID=UPI00221E88BC|nr:uncharacterized protein B0P05DRAFT_589307 [Gilbertella persicaria]KAI8069843.1 hypothetical protein B0P05DRAFT_589307 [Gilbertella persicaria]